MKKFLGLLILIYATPLLVIAQEPAQQNDPIPVRGEVISLETGEVIPYVHIIDQTKSQGTTSNIYGKFAIMIEPTDTLVFSAVGFEKLTIVLAQEGIDLKENIQISLAPSTYELGTVQIHALKDEAGFKQDILNLRLPEEKKITIPNTYEGPRDPNARFSLASGPFSAVQNMFSKEAKEIRKYQEAIKDYPREMTIATKYNREIVKEITGLENEELNDFMLFCKVPDDFILSANDYEIVLAVNNCYKDFLKAQH